MEDRSSAVFKAALEKTSYTDSALKLINKGMKKLQEELEKVKPSLIKDK